MKKKHLLNLLLNPNTIALLGLILFVKSFFLSKRSLTTKSSCLAHGGASSELLQSQLNFTNEEIQKLQQAGVLATVQEEGVEQQGSNGCWMPRMVDAVAFVVVDALRFDFALHHLPLSVGKRLGEAQQKQQQQQQRQSEEDNTASTFSSSQLYQFIADPPTVTAQRLLGLTTGGLPTFADISGSFGGALVDEDSWVEQLHQVLPSRRGYYNYNHNDEIGDDVKPLMAFAGDDTWMDLFPTAFHERHAYPSFNTRDLDTVDNGCNFHLPRLLHHWGRKSGDSASSTEGAFKGEDSDETANKDTNHSKPESELEGHVTYPLHLHPNHFFELLVLHYLGVDHVGHTYGPLSSSMTSKLHDMDVALDKILQQTTMDHENNNNNNKQQECKVVLVLGDHGMTQEGNHGGGTAEEVNAALFVHFSEGCGETAGQETDGIEAGAQAQQAFRSIHQIDLVPTISLLLGLPIPYSNMGSVVPALLPPLPPSSRSHAQRSRSVQGRSAVQGRRRRRAMQSATALSLNAAQMWRYFETYAHFAPHTLPKEELQRLHEELKHATKVLQLALFATSLEEQQDQDQDQELEEAETDQQGEEEDEALLYKEAAGLYKLALANAAALGRKVWTQFDTTGMGWGIALVVGGTLMHGCKVMTMGLLPPFWFLRLSQQSARVDSSRKACTRQQLLQAKGVWWEVLVAWFMTVFHSVVVPFGNSYILSEQAIVMYLLAVLCLFLAYRRVLAAAAAFSPLSNIQGRNVHIGVGIVPLGPTVGKLLALVLSCRVHEVMVSGHGTDPSIRGRHLAQNRLVFGLSLVVLACLCVTSLYGTRCYNEKAKLGMWRYKLTFCSTCNLASLLCLGVSWNEKCSLDPARNGYLACRFVFTFVLLGLVTSLWWFARGTNRKDGILSHKKEMDQHVNNMLWNLAIGLMGVTGPSAAASLTLLVVQSSLLWELMSIRGSMEIHPSVLATMFRLCIRHAFFATNHACSFNRLQFSAAFVATDVFAFYPAALQLFWNTFGWDVLGLIWLRYVAHLGENLPRRTFVEVWQWLGLYALVDVLGSCVSVTVMRRHLMVWAIFAPRFAFAVVFFGLTVLVSFLGCCLSVDEETCAASVHGRVDDHVFVTNEGSRKS